MEDKNEASVSMASEHLNKYDAREPVEGTAEMGLKLTKADDERDIVAEQHGGDCDEPHDYGDLDDEHQGPLTCREKLKEFLHTQKFQITVIVLVALDCVFVIGELVLDYEALAEAKQCGTQAPPVEGGTTADHADNSSYGGESGEVESDHNESATAQAAEAFHYLSLIILSIFMVELVLKLIALGAKFFHSKLEVFDAIIIIISFVLDIITLLFPENFAVLDLIIVLRLWRIVRIVNGVILSVEQRAEKRIHHQKRVKDRAVMAAMKFEKYSSALEEEIQTLKELLETNGVKIDEQLFKNRPEKPHYDRKYHMTSEDDNGDHHHHFHLHHRHKNHDQSKEDLSQSHQPESNKPPHYDDLHHGNHEETC